MRERIITEDVIADPRSRYGHGRAATRHFRTQRLTGASNIIFVGFLVFLVVRLAGSGRAEMVGLVGHPLVGLPFAVLFAIVCIHMRIGMREIIEDYVHDPRLNRLSLSLNTFFCLLVGAVGVISIVKLVFWG